MIIGLPIRGSNTDIPVLCLPAVTAAASAIYLYAWLVPAGFYAFLHWRGNHAGYTFLELACLYGYSFTIYIPISVGYNKC